MPDPHRRRSTYGAVDDHDKREAVDEHDLDEVCRLVNSCDTAHVHVSRAISGYDGHSAVTASIGSSCAATGAHDDDNDVPGCRRRALCALNATRSRPLPHSRDLALDR